MSKQDVVRILFVCLAKKICQERALMKHLTDERREAPKAPVGPSAVQERNVVGLLYTKKIINIIFFGLAAAAAKQRRFSIFCGTFLANGCCNAHNLMIY